MYSLIKSFRSIFKRKKKLDDIIEISTNGNLTTIEIKTDLLLKISGSTITLNKGYLVNIADEIHLNPSLNVKDYENSFDLLPNDIEEHKIKKKLENDRHK